MLYQHYNCVNVAIAQQCETYSINSDISNGQYSQNNYTHGKSKLQIHTLERLQNLSQLKILSQYETDVKLRFRDKDANLSSLINIISRKSNPYKNDVQLEFTESKKL